MWFLPFRKLKKEYKQAFLDCARAKEMKKVESGYLLSLFSSIKRAIERKQNSFLTEAMFQDCILLKGLQKVKEARLTLKARNLYFNRRESFHRHFVGNFIRKTNCSHQSLLCQEFSVDQKMIQPFKQAFRDASSRVEPKEGMILQWKKLDYSIKFHTVETA